MSLKNKGVPSKDNTVIAYVHNVSPPRKNRRNTMDYCTLTLQTDGDPHSLPALLFSKQKRKILVDHEASRSPVKLQRLTKSADGEKYIINDMTKISDPRPDEYSFQFEELSSASDQLASVREIKDVYENGSTVNVKGKILHVGESRLIPSKQLKVCQLIFGDTTGTIELDVWENFIEKFKKGHCYSISPVQIRSWSEKKKISSLPHSIVAEMTVKESDELARVDLTTDDEAKINENSATVNASNIYSIDKLETFLRCDKCAKKVLQVSASTFIHCDYCGRHTRVANFKKDICVKFIILRKEDEEKLELTAFGNALTGVCHNILLLSSDQEVAETLLALENIYVTYNLSSMVVSSIF